MFRAFTLFAVMAVFFINGAVYAQSAYQLKSKEQIRQEQLEFLKQQGFENVEREISPDERKKFDDNFYQSSEFKKLWRQSSYVEQKRFCDQGKVMCAQPDSHQACNFVQKYCTR